MKKLIIRGVTGLVFVSLLISAILYNHISFGVLFAIVTGLAVNEFCNLVQEYKKTTFSTYLAVLGGVYLFFALFATTYLEIANTMMLFIPYILLVIYIFVRELYRKEGGATENYAYFTLSQIYAALPFAILNILAAHGGNGYNYIFPIAIFIFLWSNDTGAFCVGCSIGRHKMFERISPKKSWEGFVGGAVTAILAGYIISLFFEQLNTLQWMGMALPFRTSFNASSIAQIAELDLGNPERNITASLSGILASGNPSCIAESTHAFVTAIALGYANPISSALITSSLRHMDIRSPPSISLAR